MFPPILTHNKYKHKYELFSSTTIVEWRIEPLIFGMKGHVNYHGVKLVLAYTNFHI